MNSVKELQKKALNKFYKESIELLHYKKITNRYINNINKVAPFITKKWHLSSTTQLLKISEIIKEQETISIIYKIDKSIIKEYLGENLTPIQLMQILENKLNLLTTSQR